MATGSNMQGEGLEAYDLPFYTRHTRSKETTSGSQLRNLYFSKDGHSRSIPKHPEMKINKTRPSSEKGLNNSVM